jgi:hypothetical protein
MRPTHARSPHSPIPAAIARECRRAHRSRFRPAVNRLEDRTLLSLLATTTALSASAPSPLFGQTETFTATVTPLASGSGSATGTVTFSDGSTVLGTASLTTAGGITTATLASTTLAVGTHSVTAVYGGDSNFAGSATGDIRTIAGTDGYGDGGLATAAALDQPNGVAVDNAGRLFIADSSHNLIREVTPGPGGLSDRTITTIAVTGLNHPTGLAVDSADDLFIGDSGNNRVLEVTPGPGQDFSAVATVAVAVTGQSLIGDLAVAVNAQGNRLFIAEFQGGVYEVTPGPNGFSGGTTVTHVPETAATDLDTRGVAVDSGGDHLFVATDGALFESTPGPDGLFSEPPITSVPVPQVFAAYQTLHGVVLDSNGNLFALAASNALPIPNPEVIEFAPVSAGDYSHVALTTVAVSVGGPSDQAELAVDSLDDLVVADTFNNQVREITPGPAENFSSVTTTNIAGNGSAYSWGDGGPATAAGLSHPVGVALDAMGDLFIADLGSDSVREVRSDGTIVTVASNVAPNYQDTAAIQEVIAVFMGALENFARLSLPAGEAVDAAGGVVEADQYNVIREHGPDGTIRTVAGDGSTGYSGDGGPAIAAQLSNSNPWAVAMDGADDLFIADVGNKRIREVTPDGIIHTVAGNGAFGYSSYDEGRPATDATLGPIGVAVDSSGNLFVAEYDNNRIRRVTGTMSVTVRSNAATAVSVVASPTSPAFGQPVTLSATVSSDNNGIVFPVVFPTGTVTFYDGNTDLGTASLATTDGVTKATLPVPGLAVGSHAIVAVYSGDNNGFESRTSPQGSFTLTLQRASTTAAIAASITSPIFGQSETFTATVATVSPGSGTPTGTVTFYDGAINPADQVGVGALSTTNGVTTATLTTTALAVGPHSVTAVYSGDSNFTGSVSRTMSTVAGNGMGDYYLNNPCDVAVENNGDLLIADTGDNAVLEATPGGTVTPIAGGSDANHADGLAFDNRGNLFIANTGGFGLVEEITPGSDGSLVDGTLTTVTNAGFPTGIAVDGAGNVFWANTGGVTAYPDVTATQAIGIPLSYPTDVVIDARGDLLIADSGNNAVYELTRGPDGLFSDGTIATIAGNGFAGYFGDGGPARTAALNWPAGLAVDGSGDLFIADSGNNAVREVTVGSDGLLSDGTISTVAGNGTASTGGDGGPATNAALSLNGAFTGLANGMAVDSAGNLFIADSGNNVIRRAGGLLLDVQPVNTTNLGTVLSNSQQGALTLQTTSNASVSAAIQAINGLPSPAMPETVTLDLGSGTYTTDTHVSTAPGMTLVITDGTLVGGSPALIVDSGNVTLDHVTALNATNAPTIVVNGGSLTIRGSTIQESTGYSQTAILINGGGVDLGTAASPGGNTINVNGTGELVDNTTASSVPDFGNTLEVNATSVSSSDLSFTSLVSSATSSVFGQSVTVTAAVRAANPADGTPTGGVDFVDTTTGMDLGTVPVSNGIAKLTTSALAVGGHAITAQYNGNSVFAFSLATLTQTVQKDSTATAVSSSAGSSNLGQGLTFTAKVTSNAPGSGAPTGSVDYFDATTNIDLTPGGVALSSGIAAFATTSLPVGTNTITVSYGGDGGFLTSAGSLTVTIKPSIIVVDPTASGALTVSGNASIALTTVSGSVFVNSSSSIALSASGNAQVKASLIDVHGGVQKSGNASFSPAPITGAAPLPDPLAALASPSTTGVTNHGSESLSGNSRATISPGIYTQINVSGNASLTLGAGIYIIEGGGLTVSGNASIIGTGIMVYNAGSNYPGSGGNFGGITLSGNGMLSMSAPTTGTYAGVLIFQSRQNTRALSFSGNAMDGMTGTIYAASALLSMSGNSQLQNPLVVGTLNLGGNVSVTETAAGSDGADDALGLADTLMAGDLSAYINDPSGLFTADELARIQDAINDWDALLAPYSVTITEVSDPTLANIVIDTSTTSASGGADAGVLGCYNGATGEITIIQGWNWYAGSDTSQIGADQYDFETTVTHELGHALGLGHSTDTSSPMYATLATGVANRTVTTLDLNIPDPPGGADPQIAAGFQFVVASPTLSQSGYAAAPGSGPSPGATGLIPLSPVGVTTTSFWPGLMAQSNLLQAPAGSIAQQARIRQAGPDPSLLSQATVREDERALSPWLTPASTDDVQAFDPQWRPASSRPLPGIDSQTGYDHAVVQQPTTLTLDAALADVGADSVLSRGDNSVRTTGIPALLKVGLPGNPVSIDLKVRQDRPGTSGGFTARLAAIVLAAGPCGFASGMFDPRNRRDVMSHQKRKSRYLADLPAARRR